MAWFCYHCVQPRSQCVPGVEPGGCAAVEAEAAEYRASLDGSKRVYFGSVPGGTTATAGLMDHTRKFDRDMHVYREAVRAGEQPDQVSEAAVLKARKRQEMVERAQKRGILDGAG